MVEVVLLQERTRVQAVVRAKSRRVDRITQYAVHLDECEYAQMCVCMYVCMYVYCRFRSSSLLVNVCMWLQKELKYCIGSA